jgi:hypothetical protein
MKRGVAVLAFGLLLAGCGGAAEPASQATTTAAATPTPSYAEQWLAEYDVTLGAERDKPGGSGTTADWSAFVVTVSDLEPPDGSEGDHNRMVAAFQAYVDARSDAEQACEGVQAGEGNCYGAVLDEGDAWQAALDSSYELPGISGP